MTDSLKFGPEWLRNLSSEGNTGGAPKYQLAEHRYGREEMLALFDRSIRAPDHLVKLQGLYVEKTQTPMALLTMTEEETRQWHKGINSDVVLRLNGKTLVGSTGGVLRGRGGSSIDRGRGRLRGSGGFHYTRGLSYEEQSESTKEGGPPDRLYSRGIRSFDRSQGSERAWGERNGVDSADWNGSTSPRKEFSSVKDFSSGGRSNENWRRHRGPDDEEGWRKPDKWVRSNSWRDENDVGEMGLSKSLSRTSSWGRGWADEGLRSRSHDEDSLSSKRNNFIDEVPEWAIENPSEIGGSFDASGAFHGGNYSDEEEENIGSRSSRNRVTDDGHVQNKSKSSPQSRKSNQTPNINEESEEPDSLLKERKLLRSQTARGNLSDTSKGNSQSLSKSQSSSNLKSEHPESNLVSSKRSESQTFDRIRVQHQNFVDKNGINKDCSEVGDTSKANKKETAVEPNCVVEEVMKSETSAILNSGISDLKEKSSIFSKGNLNKLPINAGVRLAEAEQEMSVNRQGSEDDMERMSEVVKDTVVKLFEDEEKPPVNVNSDKWYYRDPQGVVQGPFKSSEMLEWFMNGYFQLSLLVRREQDELYVKLGDLMLKCSKVPFLPGVNLPVIKADSEFSQQPPPAPVQPQPHGLTQPDLFMQQFHQYQILQKQFLLSQQMALNKLSQSEIWNTLSPVQQRALLMQKVAMAQQPPLNIDQLAQVEKNPLSQLIYQMQQNKHQIPEVRDNKNIDPVRQLLQHMNVMQMPQPPLVTPLNPAGVVLNHHLNPQSHLNSVINNSGLNATPVGVEDHKVEDPIQSLLRQLGNQSNVMPTPTPTASDSLWGAPGRPQHWPQVNPPVSNTGGLPMWEIKTEQQILAEQQLRLDEERRQEEFRKKKEEEEEAAKKLKELEEKKKEEERIEEMKILEIKKLEKEKIRVQKEKEKEEKKKAEELKKKQQQEEALKKKQEAAKKAQEAQKKKEEKERKKEEEREKKRLLEEGKKKAESEKKKKEEEQLLKKKKEKEEEEEIAKKQEQLKKPMEALKKMQDQQMEPFKKPLPWSQPAMSAPGTSLSEIQKMQEKEKKQQMLREQQMQKAQEKELQAQKESESRSNGLNLKWAEQTAKINANVKSLAEIQAEEHLQLTKQLEKERMERAQQQREASLSVNTGIWGNASQSLSWTNNSAPWGVTPVQNNSAPGFWDEVVSNSSKSKAKTPSSPSKGKNQTASNQKSGANSGANQKASKPKTKKEEAAVLKLFERVDDEFTAWCSESLESIHSEVDIPTFVSFLRDIESPYDVIEYVKCYLGDGKEAQDFAKQFLERRSRWMASQKGNLNNSDRNASSLSVNTSSQYQSNVGQEFQEVKSKGKKSKKGKMLKVDNRILGFSVTAAPDRINVGDRDYVNHNL